jgi:hypothetical protein
MISYNSQSDANKNLLNVRIINEIDIQIFDENNNLVNFNNLDWNITLVITTEIKYDQQEISLNTFLKNNYLDLKEPVAEHRNGFMHEKQSFSSQREVLSIPFKQLQFDSLQFYLSRIRVLRWFKL